MSTSNPTPPTFEIRTIPGRGRGLFALVNVFQGHQIHAENPLFTLPNIDSIRPTENAISCIVERLSPLQKQQFHVLYSNYVEETPLFGIVRTNVLNIDHIDAIYATFSLLNHSCVPNAHYTWNANLELGTLHAIGHISAGEEITISYSAHARGHPDFACSCQLCTSSSAKRASSDAQRARIMELQCQIEERVRIQHQECLDDLFEMRNLLMEVYEGRPGAVLVWVYTKAAEAAASQSDRARARVFAERAYSALVLCEGETHPEVEWWGRVRGDLALLDGFGSTDFRESSLDMVPTDLGLARFEGWLWTWE